jgi:hypothetical protein
LELVVKMFDQREKVSGSEMNKSSPICWRGAML